MCLQFHKITILPMPRPLSPIAHRPSPLCLLICLIHFLSTSCLLFLLTKAAGRRRLEAAGGTLADCRRRLSLGACFLSPVLSNSNGMRLQIICKVWAKFSHSLPFSLSPSLVSIASTASSTSSYAKFNSHKIPVIQHHGKSHSAD